MQCNCSTNVPSTCAYIFFNIITTLVSYYKYIPGDHVLGNYFVPTHPYFFRARYGPGMGYDSITQSTNNYTHWTMNHSEKFVGKYNLLSLTLTLNLGNYFVPTHPPTPPYFFRACYGPGMGYDSITQSTNNYTHWTMNHSEKFVGKYNLLSLILTLNLAIRKLPVGHQPHVPLLK